MVIASLFAKPATTVNVLESTLVKMPEVARTVAVPTRCAENIALLPSPAGTRSPSTTPLVFTPNDQASAAMFVTKLPKVSRAIE